MHAGTSPLGLATYIASKSSCWASLQSRMIYSMQHVMSVGASIFVHKYSFCLASPMAV